MLDKLRAVESRFEELEFRRVLFRSDHLGAELTGLDISKEAVRCAAAKYKGRRWICGTAEIGRASCRERV